MLTKPIPPWILLGGFMLTGSAGCINAVGFLGAHHQALSHMSGAVTNVGIGLAGFSRSTLVQASAILGCFFAGCVLSGMITRQSSLRLGPRYGVALAIEAALLVAATYFLRNRSITGDYLAAMACGLQNAMATTYSGAVIRTTHMTGIVTDLGIAVGLLARGEQIDRRRFGLYLVLLSGFLLGGLVGAVGFHYVEYDTLLLPAALTAAAALAYPIVRRSIGKAH